MTRSLAKSNAQFQKAIRRLPLGVSSNFRYWGEDKTIYVKSARGARLTDIDGNEYIDYRMAYGPCILGYADPRVDAAARAGMEMGGVFALSTEREYAVAERIAKHGACRRTRPLLEFRHGSGHGRVARRPGPYRQGFLRRHRGRLPRGVRRRALDHGRRGMEAGPRRSAARALQRRRPAHAAGTDPLGADERHGTARGCVQGLRRRHRRLPDRADHGQLLLDLGDPRIPARRPRRSATSTASS